MKSTALPSGSSLSRNGGKSNEESNGEFTITEGISESEQDDFPVSTGTTSYEDSIFNIRKYTNNNNHGSRRNVVNDIQRLEKELGINNSNENRFSANLNGASTRWGDESFVARESARSEFRTSDRTFNGYASNVDLGDVSNTDDIAMLFYEIKIMRERLQQVEENCAEVDESEMYPHDFYSLIALNGPEKGDWPKRKMRYFGFGLLVTGIQLLFLSLTIASRTNPGLGDVDSDSPSDEWLPQIVPSATKTVRISQFLSLFAFILFPDSSLQDIVMAIQYFPRSSEAKAGDPVLYMRIACILRGIQAILAVAGVIFVVITSNSVLDIILNFTALNFISNIDDHAFELARSGVFGPGLQKETEEIETKKLPACMHRESNHIYYMIVMCCTAFVSFGMLILILIQQETNVNWATQTFRVQFKESTGLQHYSGCFLRDFDSPGGRWKTYKSYDRNAKHGILAYCEDKATWHLFKDGDYEEDGGSLSSDPCSQETQLAHSGMTNNFDISSAFADAWFSASGTPLDMFFFNSHGNGDDLLDTCDSFLNDGKCDDLFNTLGFQYDGGDCCASTCTQTDCGEQGANGAFGTSDAKKAFGYRKCIDPRLKPLTIHLEKISSSRDPNILTELTREDIDQYYRDTGSNFWDEAPASPLFHVDCNGEEILQVHIDETMESNTELIWVEDGAICRIYVTNSTHATSDWTDPPIWWVNYSVYHGGDTTHRIASGYSKEQKSITFRRVHECYFDALINKVGIPTVYPTFTDSTLALFWLLNDESEQSNCDNDFLIERFALVNILFAARTTLASLVAADPWSNLATLWADAKKEADVNTSDLWISSETQCLWHGVTCHEGSVQHLAADGNRLHGTISTSIGLLKEITDIIVDTNGLFGKVPSEIGLLTKLTNLNFDENQLTGTIPTEFGLLVDMSILEFDNNRLTGTIPVELGQMTNAREFDLANNTLSGTIPSEIGQCTNLFILELKYNALSGTIPSEIGHCTKMVALEFQQNTLSGSIPSEITLIEKLQRLLLAKNEFSGTIPVNIGQLTNLVEFRLEDNNFSGQIPTEIGLLTSLQSIDLRGNYFTGQLPTEIGALTELEQIRLEGNQLTGAIPSQVTSLERLRTLTMDNTIGGSIPSHVRTLDSCVFCEGQSYEVVPENDNELLVFYEKVYEKAAFETNGYSCAMLLKINEDPEALLSIDACQVLREKCVVCSGGGGGPLYDPTNTMDAVIP